MALPNAITAAAVKMRFPVFRNTDDALVEFAIEEAAIQCDKKTLGSYYLPCLLYLSAHVLTRALQIAQGGVGMPMRSVSVGGEISYSYAVPDQPKLSDASDLATTAYGMRFLEFVSLMSPAVAII